MNLATIVINGSFREAKTARTLQITNQNRISYSALNRLFNKYLRYQLGDGLDPTASRRSLLMQLFLSITMRQNTAESHLIKNR